MHRFYEWPHTSVVFSRASRVYYLLHLIKTETIRPQGSVSTLCFLSRLFSSWSPILSCSDTWSPHVSVWLIRRLIHVEMAAIHKTTREGRPTHYHDSFLISSSKTSLKAAISSLGSFSSFSFLLWLHSSVWLKNHTGPASSWSHSAASYVCLQVPALEGVKWRTTRYVWVNRQLRRDKWPQASLCWAACDRLSRLKQWMTGDNIEMIPQWILVSQLWGLAGSAVTVSCLPLQQAAISTSWNMLHCC